MPKKINLKDFESKILLRSLKPEDYNDVVKLQRRCFTKMKAWLLEQFESYVLFMTGK